MAKGLEVDSGLANTFWFLIKVILEEKIVRGKLFNLSAHGKILLTGGFEICNKNVLIIGMLVKELCLLLENVILANNRLV